MFGCLYRDTRVWIMFVAANRLFSTTFIMSCYLYNYFVFILVEVVWNLSVCFCRQFIGSVASAAARPRCVEHLEGGRLVDVHDWRFKGVTWALHSRITASLCVFVRDVFDADTLLSHTRLHQFFFRSDCLDMNTVHMLCVDKSRIHDEYDYL